MSFGGSVTSGYWAGSTNPGWVDQLLPWLQQAFPNVTFKLLNLARGASDVIPAATCWYQYMPQDADLVFVEYSANGCDYLGCTSWSAPRVSADCAKPWTADGSQPHLQPCAVIRPVMCVLAEACGYYGLRLDSSSARCWRCMPFMLNCCHSYGIADPAERVCPPCSPMPTLILLPTLNLVLSACSKHAVLGYPFLVPSQPRHGNR